MNRADKIVVVSGALYVVLLAVLAMALSGCAIMNPDAKRAHRNGDGVGQTAVPKDVNYSDLHAAINRHIASKPTAPDIRHNNNAPLIPSDVNSSDITAEGAVENSDKFKDAANWAWDKIGGGTNRDQEAGFSLDRYGNEFGKVSSTSDSASTGHDDLYQPVTPSTIATFHVHPNNVEDTPSKADIAAAKKTKRVVMVASRSGLWEISPDGTVSHIYKSPSWMDEKKG